ncbi:MAG: isochorismatase family protein [Candidatus Latescibacteria bacterium]|nr:isochorismatase family protein [Candidatus Latescibacterota bacterium]
MTALRLNVQYFQDSTPQDVPCREENFVVRALDFTLPTAETALVLVDLWNVHHIDSWVERAEAMTRDIIAPLIDRARASGLTIVQAPSPTVLANFPDKYQVYQGHTPAPPPAPAPDWPPAQFRDRAGEYACFRGPRDQEPGIGPYWRELEGQLDISPHIAVAAGDFVVGSGQQLHDLCRERGIVHLIYAGFATNWCILGRDYGVRAMRGRGYNTVLVRDATEGVEFPDTLAGRWATELAVREVEQVHGFSTSTADFYAACNAL